MVCLVMGENEKLSLASSCFVWYVGTIEISVLTAVFGCGCAEGCINCEYVSVIPEMQPKWYFS